ncbi:unnamed protein product, partial [Ectocarpus sp. 12 AP-2014]
TQPCQRGLRERNSPGEDSGPRREHLLSRWLVWCPWFQKRTSSLLLFLGTVCHTLSSVSVLSGRSRIEGRAFGVVRPQYLRLLLC